MAECHRKMGAIVGGGGIVMESGMSVAWLFAEFGRSATVPFTVGSETVLYCVLIFGTISINAGGITA
jgi:hypothetical protein